MWSRPTGGRTRLRATRLPDHDAPRRLHHSEIERSPAPGLGDDGRDVSGGGNHLNVVEPENRLVVLLNGE